MERYRPKRVLRPGLRLVVDNVKKLPIILQKPTKAAKPKREKPIDYVKKYAKMLLADSHDIDENGNSTYGYKADEELWNDMKKASNHEEAFQMAAARHEASCLIVEARGARITPRKRPRVSKARTPKNTSF